MLLTPNWPAVVIRRRTGTDARQVSPLLFRWTWLRFTTEERISAAGTSAGTKGGKTGRKWSNGGDRKNLCLLHLTSCAPTMHWSFNAVVAGSSPARLTILMTISHLESMRILRFSSRTLGVCPNCLRMRALRPPRNEPNCDPRHAETASSHLQEVRHG